MAKSVFPVRRGPWAGMTEAQVTVARDVAREQLLLLLSGARPMTASYDQGGGSRSVTFAGASEAQLRNNIREMNVLLGVEHRRRPMRPYFR